MIPLALIFVFGFGLILGGATVLVIAKESAEAQARKDLLP